MNMSPARSAQEHTPGALAMSPDSFHAYLHQHRLFWHEVAQCAQVPTLVIWSIAHGLAVSPSHATRVRSALHALTGIPFTGPIRTPLFHEQPHQKGGA